MSFARDTKLQVLAKPLESTEEEMAFMGKSYQAIVFNFGPGEENHYIIDEFLFKELQKYLSENH